MPFSTRAVANHVLDEAERIGISDVSPMKLQKLVYLAHGWYLAFSEQPLIDELVQAWRWGPVIPSLYHEFSHFGNEPITDRAREMFQDEPAALPRAGKQAQLAIQVINRVLDRYGTLSALQLSALTHQSGTPWDQSFDANRRNLKGQVIPNETIQSHYRALAKGRSA